MMALYSLFAVGVNLHMHFCGGELEHVSFYTEVVDCCGSSPMDCCAVETGCCSTKEFRIAIEDEHQAFSSPAVDDIIAVWESTDNASSESLVQRTEEIRNDLVRGSPPSDPIYLKFSRLTYYG